MTQNSKHTDGPWTLDTVVTSSGVCHKIGPFPWKAGKENHACIYVDYPGTGPIEAELLANARLIAAAPELLAALQTLERAIANNEPFSRAEHDQAKSAIAKATGAAPK